MNLSDNMRGAVFMMISMAAFVINDSLMKSLAGEIPLFQAIFLRGVFATMLVGALAARAGVIRWSALAPVDRPVAMIRVCAEIGVTSCFLQALFNMPLANATAILQCAPVALTFAAAVFLREKVGWRRWSAVMVGFFGVLLIVRPGGEDFNSASYYALGAVCFLVVRDLSTRRLSPETPSLFITMMTAIAITCLGGAVTATQSWQAVEIATLAQLALSACFLFCGYLFSVMTMRVGEMSFIAPFRYTILVWALLLGIFVFGEIPDTLAFIGAAIVVSAGLYTFFRERRLRLSAAPLGQHDPADDQR